MKTVFIADTNERLRKGLGSLLRTLGFNTIEGADIKEAGRLRDIMDVAIISLEIPSLNIDSLMPTPAGNVPAHKPLLILTTTGGTPELEEKLTNCKDILLLEKPFSFKELIHSINRYFTTGRETKSGSKKEVCHEKE